MANDWLKMLCYAFIHVGTMEMVLVVIKVISHSAALVQQGPVNDFQNFDFSKILMIFFEKSEKCKMAQFFYSVEQLICFVIIVFVTR